MEKLILKLYRLLNFEVEQVIEDDAKSVVTTGSIVFGVIVRTAIIMIVGFYLVDYYYFRGNWWVIALALWFLVAYPAYRRYNKFNKEIEEFSEDTLCGKCKYFDKSSKLCTIYDQHPTETFIPCDGESWEPRSEEK